MKRAVIREQPAVLEVDTGDRRLQEVGVVQRADQLPDRARDLTRIQQRRGHLVQQRSEQVVVVAVDKQDVDRRVLQRPRACQPAESRSRDDDAGSVHCGG